MNAIAALGTRWAAHTGDPGAANMVFSYGGSDLGGYTGGFFSVGLSGGKPAFQGYAKGVETGLATCNDGARHQIAVTLTGRTLSFYVDGAADSVVTLSWDPITGTNWGGGIASGPAGQNYFPGTVDEVGLFASVLTTAQIANLYQIGLEHLSGSAVLTGAGVATIVGKKGASFAPALTGAGTATLAGAKGAKSAQTLTGAGVATVAQSTARASAATLTGAGVATVATRKGAQTAPALTGAGVLTAAITTARSAAVTLTGAGVATITTAAESHSSSVAATGAGAVTVSIASARFGAALLSGGGVLTETHSTARAGAVTGAGAGVVTVDAIAAISLGLAARMRIASEPVGMRIASEPVGMRIASVSDAPIIRRSA